jgi:NAD(P)-dependent dehydrogenase (short-subunit alcohol dehydrogenase family)
MANWVIKKVLFRFKLMTVFQSSKLSSSAAMSSIAGRLGYPYRLAYSTSKWGLIGFTKTLSMDKIFE